MMHAVKIDERQADNRTGKEPEDNHLQLLNLEKRYGESVLAVRDLSLPVRKGELIALLGPSGCGKTTTLRMIAGLIPATAGQITVGGRDVTNLPPYRRDMGLVFQNYALFPHMTVERNVAFGLEMRKIPRDRTKEMVAKALDLVQLGHLAERRPKELSGGQQQRVALARALVIEPSILLLDEPLSNLDAKLRDQMRIEIRDIQQRLGITTVFVTHDQVEALSMCDRIAVMHKGKLAQIGTPFEVYERPRTQFVAEFVGRINKMPGALKADGAIDIGLQKIRCENPSTPPGPVDVMIRPHRIEISSKPFPADGANHAQGRIVRSTYIGDTLEHHIDLGGTTLRVEKATTAGPQPVTVGDAVHLRWAASDTLVFGEEE